MVERLVGKLAAAKPTAVLHVTVAVRLRHDPPTHACVEPQTREDLSKMGIIRCLKRHLARKVYRTLCADHRTGT